MLAVPIIAALAVIQLQHGDTGGWWMLGFCALITVCAIYNAWTR